MDFAGEILSSAPYYQNIRKHSTCAGEIICTGAGCVGCSPEKNGDENILRILGDVDSVQFEGKTEIQKKDGVGKRPATAPGCHSDDLASRNRGKITAKSTTKTTKSNSSKKMAKDYQKSKKSNNFQRRKTDKIDTQNHTSASSKNNRSNTTTKTANLEVPGQRRKVTFSKRKSYYEEPENVRKLKIIDQRRSLYNVFPGKVTRLGSIPSKTSTTFLEMLKSSESGIYDLKILERKQQSIWIEKIKEQGVTEEELLPKIPLSLRERLRAGDGSERDTVDKNIQTVSNSRTKNQFLRHVSLNSRVQTRGGESILIIEHEHDKKKKTDATLYRLGFSSEFQSQREFPNVSIIDIADSLGEFVDMGAIKVIQRRNKKWLVLVEGKSVKEFLLDSGVVLGGRHFDLFEMKTF